MTSSQKSVFASSWKILWAVAALLIVIVWILWQSNGTEPTRHQALESPALPSGNDRAANERKPSRAANGEAHLPAIPLALPVSSDALVTRNPVASTDPLPAADTPLALVYANLAARAEAGDAAAASRIFNDVHKCSSARDADAEVAAQAGTYLDAQTGTIKATVTPEAAKGYHALQNYTEKYREFCAGLSAAQIDSLMPMSLLAAQLGDAGAMACFLNLSPQLDKALAANPDWQAQFNSVALTIAENAVQSGDWKAVRLLAGSYNDPNGFWLLSRSTGTDLGMSYRYLKLMQLGLNDGDTADLNIRLENIAKQLAPSIIAQGDSWASDTYQQFFARQHPFYAAPNASICPQPD